MKTPRERAMAIMYEVISQEVTKVSPRVFAILIETDMSEASVRLRRMVDAIEKGITTDRKEVAAETAPS